MRRDISLLQHPTPDLLQHPTGSRGEELSGSEGDVAGSGAALAACHGAPAFWGGECSGCSLPGWDPLPRAVGTTCLVRTDTSGPTCASISCRISLCSVLLRT